MVSKPKRHKTPPGTLFLKENLFIDKTEIANVHWREFTQAWILGIEKDSAKYLTMRQDTSVWGEELAFSNFYHMHPSYNNYPVVGISYDQAIEFLKWRSDRVNELYSKHPLLNPFPGKKFKYRLPTKEEWEFAAAGKLNKDAYPYGLKSIVGTKGVFKGSQLFNCRYPDTTHRYGYMSPANSFPKNTIGLHNMIGNVSEMILEKGFAKGGNFGLTVEQCKIPDQQLYTKPERWLGLRAVCEITD